MAAQEDSLLSPITAAADCSESTTLLVAKVSCSGYRADILAVSSDVELTLEGLGP